MKKANAILLLVAFLAICNTGYTRTIDPNYAVGTWQGFRTAAISYTFDDGCPKQYTVAIPMFNTYGYKLTMFTVTSPSWYIPTHWDQLQTAATAGHEIGSHTVTHPQLNSSNEVAELSNSKTTINTNITPQQCFTVAYPYCVESTESVIATYYIAGRTCSGQIMPATPSNFYQISSFALGSSGTNTTAGITAIANNAASAGGWAVYLIHGIDNDGGYSPLSSTILQATLDYLKANPTKFWVSSFSNVARYIKERNDVNVIEVSNDGNTITAQVTDSLSNTIYNYPITIRRRLPSSWQSATVSQNGYSVNSSIVTVNSIKYIMFDAVPDGGDIILNIFYVPPVPPVAQDVNTSTLINTPVSITLVATDDGLPDPPGVLSYIIASLPGNGTLSDPCAGSINSVPYTLAGNGKQVIYTPATNYGGVDSFTFKANDGGSLPDGGDSNIATVSITIRYSITATAGPNGSISPSGTFTKYSGQSQLFNATSSIGYTVDKWYLDGNDVQTGGNTYTLNNIQANHTISVTFKVLQFSITASSGPNGIIEPNGTFTKNYDESQIFNAAPDTGYMVDQWYLNGNLAQTGGLIYTLNYIRADAIVLVNFKPTAVLTMSVSPSEAGITVPAIGTNEVARNEAIPVSAQSNAGYSFLSWTANPPENAVFGNANAASTTVTLSGNATVTAHFNSKPAADINASVTMLAIPDANSATLDATGSTDDGLPNPPGALTYLWEKVAGPNECSISEPNAAITEVSFSGMGVFEFRLTVSDGQLEDTKLVTITVVLDVAYVSTTGDDNIGSGTAERPFATIQKGINTVRDNGTVIVLPGTYYENINFSGKKITVRSTNPNDANVVANSVINANGSGSTVVFNSGEDANSVLAGFTITGGETELGGGIYINEASPIIERNVIRGNRANTEGGGIYCQGGSATIRYNELSNNYSSFAGGVSFESSFAILQSNLIVNNTADCDSGVACVEGQPRITNNTIAGNSAVYDYESSGLVILSTLPPIISNNIIAFNYGAPGVVDFGGFDPDYFSYNDVYGHPNSNYLSSVLPEMDQTGVNGNISVNPLFADIDANNYHLQAVSLCINAGDPNYVSDGNEFDMDGGPRVIGGRIDIGAYEFIPADLNIDGKVNLTDYVIFADHWMDDTCSEPNWCEGTDFDQSGSVDILDLATFAGYWLSGS
jgi:peptidoglycan-N-acetylglucosamine deacetylase